MESDLPIGAIATADPAEKRRSRRSPVGRASATGMRSSRSRFTWSQHVRRDVARECLGEPPGAEGGREVVDELGRRDEERVEAVLDRAVAPSRTR
jgi:hypothetical protein